jgi:Zn-dependent peptidase ImmA (M78 family)
MPRSASDGKPPSRSSYYRAMRTLANEKRRLHEVESAKLDLPFMARIYKAEGIKIDRRNLRGYRIRACYFCDNNDFSVLLKTNMPREPKIFALAHELKHHFVDQPIIMDGTIRCGDYNRNELIEKTAEVFAAEFIYPESEMLQDTKQMGLEIGSCAAEDIVRFKLKRFAPISYMFIMKRFEWFGFFERGAYDEVQFTKLEEKMYGTPIYKQEWFRERRKGKTKSSRDE